MNVRHGKHRKRRAGVHKNRHSPEVLRWNREQLIPERPDWMPAETYTALASLRAEIDGSRTS